MANPLKLGAKAPDFRLADQNGAERSLAQWRGKYLVLYFYPKDATPGCTIEANDFTRLKGRFTKLNADVVGVSGDGGESHCRFIEKEGLTITLLSDPQHAAMQSYGVWREKTNYGKTTVGLVRSTFLIDPDGKLVKIWDPVKVDGHAEAVLAAIQSAMSAK